MLQRFGSLFIAIAKTLLAACSTEPLDHRAESAGATLMPISAQAEASGRAVGVVTTTRLTRATPATVYAQAAGLEYSSDTGAGVN